MWTLIRCGKYILANLILPQLLCGAVRFALTLASIPALFNF